MAQADTFYQDVRGSLAQIYPEAYLSSWSGAEYHDLTASSSADYVLFSDAFAQDREVFHYNQRVFLKKIPLMTQTGILTIPSPNGGFKVADVHRTLVDMLYDTFLAGGEEIISESWENYFLRPDADASKLASYAHQFKMPDVVTQILKRLKENAAR